MTIPILQPAPLDIVPADVVAGILEHTQQELAELEQQCAAAEAAAAEAERRVPAGSFDPAFNAWALERLERLVAAMRDEHEAEMESLLVAAEQRGRACVDRAHVDADTIVSYARALRASGEPEAVAAAPLPAPTLPAPTPGPVAPPLLVMPDPPGPAADGTPSRLIWRPDESAPPEPPVVVSPVPVAPAPVVVAPVTVAPEPVAPEPVAVAVTVAPPPPPPAAPVDLVEDEPADPAAAEVEAAPVAESGLKGLLARLPTFAILQVLAVIVVLIIVLIKIG